MEDAIATHSELIQVEKDKFTTQAALNLELNTIRLMQRGRGAVEPIASSATVEDCLGETLLNGEQKRAVAISATTSDQVMAWQGVAGAGKTYALNTLKELAQAQGFEVRGLAPSVEAAHGLGEALGIETETVAGLLVSQPPDQSQRPTLWIIDEAGLLSMKDAHTLMRRAILEQARVLLVGDTRQLSAVEAGNPFKSLQAGGITTAYLEIHRRQQSKVLRSAVEKVAQGQIAEGIQLLEKADCLKELAEAEERSQQIAQDYLTLPAEEREKTLVLTGTNQERLALTQRIRTGLQAEGALDADSFTLKGLRRRDLTTAQASYVTAYSPGDVLVPVQDYRKQGLLRGEQYTVLAVDKDSHQLALETPSGSVMSVDPALCPQKTVYATQALPIAVGDKLRWTRNNPKTGVRNGQTFVVMRIKADGEAEIVNAEGKTRRISLSGKQYVDYAWVSTTYSSQGKTANRVLALLGETTHREAFYVAISRAKYGLTLYTASREELTRLAQASRARENVSDYAPLFGQVGEYEQQPQNPEPVSNIDYRAVGERIGKRIAEQLAAVAGGNPGEHRTIKSLGAERTGFERGFEELAASLEPHLKPLADAIAGYHEQRDLLGCVGDLADAATAINLGLEQLEQSAENRVELTAAVDRLNRTLGKKVGQLVTVGEPDLGRSPEHSSAVADIPDEATKGEHPLPPNHDERKAKRVNLREADSQSPALDSRLPTPDSQDPTQLSPRQHYQQMWAHYSQGIEADNPVRLDYRVCRRAFEDGQSFKDMALMLTAGSPYVQWMAQAQGKEKSRVYVNQTARQACQKEKKLTRPRQRQQERQLEL